MSLGLRVALGVVTLVRGTWAWALAPLGATLAYVLVAGCQMAAARRYEQRHPPREDA